MTEITRSQKTEERYRQQAYAAIRAYERETQEAFSEGYGVAMFIDWLVTKKPNMSKSYWRQRKASCVFFLNEKGFSAEAEYLAEIGSEGAYTYRTKKDRELRGKTSAKKLKKISEEEHKTLLKFFLTDKSSFWNVRCYYFFDATVTTGLRPSEWPGTEWIEDYTDEEGVSHGLTLKVRNAKNSNLRAHGEFRHLILSGLPKEDVQVIKRQLQLVKQSSGPGGEKIPFEKYYKEVRRRFSNVVSKLWPARKMRPSLYTGRHQFAANLKKAGYSRAEIAALMGHATDDTAHEHYGKKRAGRKSGGLVRAVSQEVQRIRVVIGEAPSQQLRSKGPSRSDMDN